MAIDKREEVELLQTSTVKGIAKDGQVMNREGEVRGHYHHTPVSKTWTRERMFEEARTWADDKFKLAERKNADYASSGDPFMNLRRGGPFGIAVRMDDKVSRMINLLKDMDRVAMVEDETVEETVGDLFNYAWLCAMLLMEMKEGQVR